MGIVSLLLGVTTFFIAVDTYIEWLFKQLAQWLATMGFYAMAAIWGTVGLRTEKSVRRKVFYSTLAFLAALDTTALVLRLAVGPEWYNAHAVHLLSKFVFPAVEMFIAAIIVFVPVSLMQFTRRGSKPDPTSPTGWLSPATLELRHNLCFQLFALYATISFYWALEVHQVRRILCRTPFSMAVFMVIERLVATMRGGVLVAIVGTMKVERVIKVEEKTDDVLELEVLGKFGNKLL